MNLASRIMGAAIRKNGKALANLMFPPLCPLCSRPVWSEDAPFCMKCAAQLQSPAPITCGGRYYSAVVAAFAYGDPLRTLILDLKFNGKSGLSESLGLCLAEAVSRAGHRCDLVSWIPISTARLMTRKYDQAKLLALSAAKYLSLDCAPTLFRAKNTKENSTLSSAVLRTQNVSGAFVSLESDIRGKRVLLVDDVFTSGSTMNEGARVLTEAGAGAVVAGVICSASSHKENGDIE